MKKTTVLLLATLAAKILPALIAATIEPYYHECISQHLAALCLPVHVPTIAQLTYWLLHML